MYKHIMILYLNQSPSIYQLSLLEQGHIYLRGQGKVFSVFMRSAGI